MKTKVIWAIQLLEEKGTALREPYSSPLREGLFELRIKFGSDIVRCLYFFHKGQIVILTNGFTKKTDKTPRREIEKAKRYRADWGGKSVARSMGCLRSVTTLHSPATRLRRLVCVEMGRSGRRWDGSLATVCPDI